MGFRRILVPHDGSKPSDKGMSEINDSEESSPLAFIIAF